MSIKPLLVAAALALSTAAPVAAAPIEIDFSFDDVSGTFYGLDDNVGGFQSASSFDFVGAFGITYKGVEADADNNSDRNIFGFNNFTGELLLADFTHVRDVEASSVTSSVTSTLFRLRFQWIVGRLSTGGLPTGNFETDENAGFGGVDSSGLGGFRRGGAPVFTTRPVEVAAVPLPAGGLLLLSGLAGIAGFKRRKKRSA